MQTIFIPRWHHSDQRTLPIITVGGLVDVKLVRLNFGLCQGFAYLESQ